MPFQFASGITKASGITPASGIVGASGITFLGRAVTNPIDKYVWDTSYECQDATVTTWSPADAGVVLSSATNATLGQSTAAWTNLPARFVDEGVSPPTTGMFNALFDWENNDFHCRLLVDLDATVINGDRLLRYLVTGIRLAELRIVSESNWQFLVRNDASGGLYSTFVTPIPTTALLIDWQVSGDQMNVYINGTDFSPAANPGGPVDFANGPDLFEFMGLNGGNVAEGTYVFIGFRWAQLISFADHQADAAELGV